jgi:hypothetical protein
MTEYIITNEAITDILRRTQHNLGRYAALPAPVPCTWTDSAGNRHTVKSIRSYMRLVRRYVIPPSHSMFAAFMMTLIRTPITWDAVTLNGDFADLI